MHHSTFHVRTTLIILLAFSCMYGMQDNDIEMSKNFSKMLIQAIEADSVEIYKKIPQNSNQAALFNSATEYGAHKVATYIASSWPLEIKNNLLAPSVENHCLIAVRALVDAGADTNYRPQGGAHPLEIALERLYFDIANYLFEKNARLSTYITGYSGHGIPWHKSRVQHIIERNLDSNFQITKIRWLLAHDADPDLPCSRNRHALYWAQHPEVVELLLDYGADPNTSNEEYARLSQIPIHNDHWGLANTVFLLAAGAHIDSTKNPRKLTALHLAASYGMRDLVAYLLYKGARTDIQADDGKTAIECTSDNDIKEMLWADMRLANPPAAALPMIEKIKKKKVKIP